MSKKYVSPEMINIAKKRDLAEFLMSKGEPLKKTGNRYKHAEHDSLVFTKNLYYWNSKQEKGNSLDFVMSYYNMNFVDAVEFLSGMEYDKTQNFKSKIIENKNQNPILSEEKNEIPFEYESAENINRAIAYLSKTRKIPYENIKLLASKHLISQDKKGNVVFKIFDEKNKLVGAELAGTLTDKRFKGIANNSKVGYGFNFKVGKDEKPKYTICFESPIDLISFYSLYKERLTSHRLMSLAGIRKDILKNNIDKFNIDVKTLYLAVDNDEAGQNFIKEMKTEYRDIKTFLPNENFKDWNEMLKYQFEEKKTKNINDWKDKIDARRNKQQRAGEKNNSFEVDKTKNNKGAER